MRIRIKFCLFDFFKIVLEMALIIKQSECEKNTQNENLSQK